MGSWGRRQDGGGAYQGESWKGIDWLAVDGLSSEALSACKNASILVFDSGLTSEQGPYALNYAADGGQNPEPRFTLPQAAQQSSLFTRLFANDVTSRKLLGLIFEKHSTAWKFWSTCQEMTQIYDTYMVRPHFLTLTLPVLSCWLLCLAFMGYDWNTWRWWIFPQLREASLWTWCTNRAMEPRFSLSCHRCCTFQKTQRPCLLLRASSELIHHE